MNEEEHHALASIQFSSVLSQDEIWSPLSNHVDGLHAQAVDEITRAVLAAKRRPRSTPTGLVLRGERGVGKTHMLGWLRQRVQQEGGSFFMPKLIDGRSFWAGAVHGIVNQLLAADGGQLGRMLESLAEMTGCGRELSLRLRGMLQVSRRDLDEFVERLEELDPQAALECQDTLRALVLYQGKAKLREVGRSFLVLAEGIEDTAKAEWGFRDRARVPQLLFSDLSRLFALTGPVVLAIDQIDTVLSESGRPDEDLLAGRLADGLMRMREETIRTIIVVACIPKSWELVATRAVNSAADRFTALDLSTSMPDAAIATAIVERHLGSLYGEIGFRPPYPTWPVLPKAFDDPEVAAYTPRRLLHQVENHVRKCLARNTVEELGAFGAVTQSPAPVVAAAPAPVDLAPLDERFERLRAEADVITPLDPAYEDGRMFTLLNAGLRCYILEQGPGGPELTIDPATMVKPALHARLRRTFDEATSDEEHWCFRAIAHPNARAVLTRLRSACLEAEVRKGAHKRHLVVLRNTAFSAGPKTKEAVADLEAADGLALPVSADDLRTFSALHEMHRDAPPEFLNWLAVRRPAGASGLLSQVLGTLASEVDIAQPVVEQPQQPAPVVQDSSICVGRYTETGREFRVPLMQLRSHTAVFAGSGSGKTVLLRRLVEDAAIHGVSSILIDSNNDLARLGDRWPSPPGTWEPGDADRAERYFAGTDVVIWTPRRETGRPLALNPLPDFSGVMDDPDEFRTSVDASVAGLVRRAGLTARKLGTGTAVLTEALSYFARQGGSDLGDFVALLGDLPDGVSTIKDAVRLAEGMAEELKAAMITDPVFGGAGERLDPGVLLEPAAGKRARISVISCIGLPNDDQRQTFVSQLQLALFAWIKRNPAGDRPLGGLLVLDEAQTFAPSRGTTASTESTLKLATQARKYGLGMVYATQAPKALHNMVTGNAATQFIGRLMASVQIQAATELARSKGGRIDDISRLPGGRFYGATEGMSMGKIQVPMCLSHHPPSALTEDEVLHRARRPAG
ncbi:DNA helicase HerA-like ATPase [Kibdelosporangium banguiense]|uniref:DNA helicase HerA-like ATPase n=1 Tax=Kibdelosporangium banguiense TaxID=1365924 RepID=A0ABS4TP52_9PSEU|nr:ATP-binding protein [Kibdelosporangium banguiense]MBP2326188.1 DNA helicase HerA-like ATPase [Kibdelosporangium banguiense]